MKARALLLVLIALACRRETVQRDRTEPWAAPGVSASASSLPVAPNAARARYRLAEGKVDVELPARSGKPRGNVTSLRMELELDPSAPEKSTGVVELDLASLSMFADVGDAPDAERTIRAREWLGLGASVAAELRATARKASFFVRSLEPRPAGTWLVRGELALAGVRVPRSVEVSISPPVDALTGAPERLLIRSVSPLVVSLSSHDIRPRDQHGAPAARDLELLGQKVGREARVNFVLTLLKHD